LPLPRLCALAAAVRFVRKYARADMPRQTSVRQQQTERRRRVEVRPCSGGGWTGRAGDWGPHQGEGSRRGEKGDRGSCGDGWDRPSRPARPPEERTASPYADASAATTADRFHSRGGLLRPAPSTGTSPTGQQDSIQDPPQQDPLQQGFPRQGFLQQGPLRPGPLQAAGGLPRLHPDAEGRWWGPPAWPLAAWPRISAARSCSNRRRSEPRA
jgi:hypothetical protein